MDWREIYKTLYRQGRKAAGTGRNSFIIYRYKVYFFLKTLSFWRKKQSQEFERKIQKGEIYFTTELVQTGFSDQLFGFKFLFELGNSIGLKYFYTPLKSRRSSVPFFEFTGVNRVANKQEGKNEENSESIFNFLGINSALNKISEPLPNGRINHVKVNLDILINDKNSIDTYEKLIDSVIRIMIPLVVKNRPTLFTLQAMPPFYFTFYKMIPQLAESRINYRKFYQTIYKTNTYQQVQGSSKLKIFIHIRQGDTAVIHTPWDTYIPVWCKLKGKFKQHRRLEDINTTDFIFVNDFYSFYKKISAELNNIQYSAHVFSDGFKKAFLQIYKYSRNFDVSKDEKSRLKLIENNYEEDQFSSFRKLADTRLIIGEETSKLHELIHNFMDADIFITGTQQMMIPKLVSSYFTENDMPLLIILFRNRPLDINYLGLSDENDKILHVDLENYEPAFIAKKIRNYYTERMKR